MANTTTFTTRSIVDVWDLLAERFNTHKDDPLEIHPDAAVNICVGWPVFFEQIKYQCAFLGREQVSIMDYGCGAGNFCSELTKRGHITVGTDRSKVMLDLAKSNTPQNIHYCFDYECDVYEKKMDIVTSMHVLDWIEDVDSVIRYISRLMTNNGLLLFSVFPKKHVIESLIIKDLFEDFDSETNPTKGYCNFDGVRVPVFIREPIYYDQLLDSLNFEKVLEFYPPFPKWFFKKYNWEAAKYPEMVVLAYRKRSTSEFNQVFLKEVGRVVS